MSNRNVRVNELLKREISDILHTRFQAEAVGITVTGVEVTPDHQRAKVFFSYIDAATSQGRVERLFDEVGGRIRRELCRRVILKRMPHLEFRHDESIERGVYMNELIDSLDIPDEEGEGER